MAESEKSGVALLVGAGDAIGAAVARRFAAGGYSVCVARRDAEKSRSVVQDIVASGGIARAVVPMCAMKRQSRRFSHRWRRSWDRSKFASSMPAPTSSRR